MIVKEHKAYKYRLYPSEQQAQQIRKNAGCKRWVYNKLVALGNEDMRSHRKVKKHSYTEFLSEAPWLKDADSCALDSAKRDYQKALKRYFADNNAGKPKMKTKKKSRASYRTNNNNGSIWVKKNRVKLPKIKAPIKFRKHRYLPKGSRITSATIIEETRGVFYISFSIEYDKFVPDNKVIPVNNVRGYDYSSPDFYVDDRGRKPKNPHEYRMNEEKIASIQARRDNREHGSNNWWVMKNKLAREHVRVVRKRRAFIEQESSAIAKLCGIACVEDLNLRALAGGLKLGKSTLDNGFGAFRSRLSNKLGDDGGVLVRVPKFFASSKVCSYCGEKNTGLMLDDREWSCSSCGVHHDRDVNAAVNIRNLGVFGLLLGGYIPEVVTVDGERVSVSDEFSLDSSSPDLVGLLSVVENNVLAGGTPVSAYVLSVSMALFDGVGSCREAVLLSDDCVGAFVTAKNLKASASRGSSSDVSSVTEAPSSATRERCKAE